MHQDTDTRRRWLAAAGIPQPCSAGKSTSRTRPRVCNTRTVQPRPKLAERREHRVQTSSEATEDGKRDRRGGVPLRACQQQPVVTLGGGPEPEREAAGDRARKAGREEDDAVGITRMSDAKGDSKE